MSLRHKWTFCASEWTKLAMHSFTRAGDARGFQVRRGVLGAWPKVPHKGEERCQAGGTNAPEQTKGMWPSRPSD